MNDGQCYEREQKFRDLSEMSFTNQVNLLSVVLNGKDRNGDPTDGPIVDGPHTRTAPEEPSIPASQLSTEDRAKIEAAPAIPCEMGMPTESGGFGSVWTKFEDMNAAQKAFARDYFKVKLQESDNVIKTDDGFLIIRELPRFQ